MGVNYRPGYSILESMSWALWISVLNPQALGQGEGRH